MRGLALDQFQEIAEAPALTPGDDAGELRVEAGPPLGASQERERHADGRAVGEEGSQDQAAVELGADHRGDRDDIALLDDPPGAPLRSWQAR